MFRIPKRGSKPSKQAVPPPATTPAPSQAGPAIGAVLVNSIRLGAEQVAMLEEGLQQGLAFYREYNEARLKLAFGSFDEDMRKAFFEIVYLLHVNNPTLSSVNYTAKRSELRNGVPKMVEVTEQADLYVAGAPSGVKGINMLSTTFRGDFESFTKSTFGGGLPEGINHATAPIVCLQSIGSIGTIGHKSNDSDLDLQVVYNLFPDTYDLSLWNQGRIREALKVEQGWWANHVAKARKLKKSDLQRPEVKRDLGVRAMKRVVKDYPQLIGYLTADPKEFFRELVGAGARRLRDRMLDELLRLVKRHARLTTARGINEKETLLKQRVQRIQSYVNRKYPTAEIYMFLCSLQRYRAGKYASSLEFKESSGSGYELILNYETLMPGIQFSSTIPSHFAFPAAVNNDGVLFEQLHDYMQIGALESFKSVAPKLVNLGHAPLLDPDYVARHEGAVYWEAFKASSGNLPKATLNLLRFEMLLEPKFQQTNVQLIKQPDALNHLITPRPTDKTAAELATSVERSGLPTAYLLAIEQAHPLLLLDPWWLRYKALKIGYCEPAGVAGVDEEQRDLLSRVIDLAFALHVRVSDVFRKPGDQRAFASHREQVLLEFLSSAFPPKTAVRKSLQYIFAGDIEAVGRFENDLRELFRKSLHRCQEKIAARGHQDLHKGSEEIKLWSHYYHENFEPKKNVVRKTIMKHLTFARGRVRIGFVPGEGWYFKSIQKLSGVGKRFDTFGILDHLPEEIILVERTTFIAGLATCIVNGYYGIINVGQLKQSRTMLEFDGRHMDMGNRLDNEAAFLRPDHVERIFNRIYDFFPQEAHHYTDSIRVERKVKRIFVFVNLWKFGRLSILYRDNLNTWFTDEFDHPELVERAEVLRADPEAFFASASLHESLDRFLMSQRLYFSELEVATWVNPNSLHTPHSRSQPEVEERDLTQAFEAALLKYQKVK